MTGSIQSTKVICFESLFQYCLKLELLFKGQILYNSRAIKKTYKSA